jgi:hypothetical protein
MALTLILAAVWIAGVLLLLAVCRMAARATVPYAPVGGSTSAWKRTC